MEIGFTAVAADAIARASIPRRDIGFHADYGLNARFLGFFLELPRAVEVTVVGNGEGWLLELERPCDQVIDPVGAVEEGVF
jgi:hypothetical protein